MKSFLREHLERAVWYLIVVLRILLGAIALSLVRNHHLHVALGAEGTALQERGLGCYAPGIDILTSCDIVEGVGDYCKPFEELVSEDMAGGLVHLVQASDDVALESLVHLDCCRGCCGGLWLAKVLLSEEELPVQVAHLDHVRIGQNNRSSLKSLALILLTTSDSEHSVILQKLAANSTGANHEEAGVSEFVDHVLPDDDPQAV